MARTELLRLRRLARHLGARRRRRADEPGRAHRRPAASPRWAGRSRCSPTPAPSLTSGSRSRTSRSPWCGSTAVRSASARHHRRLPRAERPAAGARRQGLRGHRQRRAHLHPPDAGHAGDQRDGSYGELGDRSTRSRTASTLPEEATAAAGRDPGQLSDAHRRQYQNFLAALRAREAPGRPRDQPAGDRGHHRRLRVGPDRRPVVLCVSAPRIAANPIPYWAKAGKSREVFEQAFARLLRHRLHRGQGGHPRGHDGERSTSTGSAATASRRRSACSAPRSTRRSTSTEEIERASGSPTTRSSLGHGPDHGVLDGRAGPDGASGSRRRLRRGPTDPAIENCGRASARRCSPPGSARCTTPTSAGSSRPRRRSSGCSTTSAPTSSASVPTPATCAGPGSTPRRSSRGTPTGSAASTSRTASPTSSTAEHGRAQLPRAGRHQAAVGRARARASSTSTRSSRALPADYDGDLMIEIDEPSVDSKLRVAPDRVRVGPARPGAGRSALALLQDADGVAEGVPNAHVGAVEVLRRLLGEVGDAALAECVVEGAGVVGDEDQAAQRTLGDQLAKLLGRRLVVERRARLLERDLGRLVPPGTRTVSQR